MIIPFDHVINLGVLEPGPYEVVQANSFARLGTFSISAAKTENPDDFDYAPISQAILQQDGRGTTVTVTVPGARPGRFLLRVRSMNGKAVNSIVDVH